MEMLWDRVKHLWAYPSTTMWSQVWKLETKNFRQQHQSHMYLWAYQSTTMWSQVGKLETKNFRQQHQSHMYLWAYQSTTMWSQVGKLETKNFRQQHQSHMSLYRDCNVFFESLHSEIPKPTWCDLRQKPVFQALCLKDQSGYLLFCSSYEQPQTGTSWTTTSSTVKTKWLLNLRPSWRPASISRPPLRNFPSRCVYVRLLIPAAHFYRYRFPNSTVHSFLWQLITLQTLFPKVSAMYIRTYFWYWAVNKPVSLQDVTFNKEEQRHTNLIINTLKTVLETHIQKHTLSPNHGGPTEMENLQGNTVGPAMHALSTINKDFRSWKHNNFLHL